MATTPPDPTHSTTSPAIVRILVLGVAFLLLVVVAAAVWLTGPEEDDTYDETDLAGWCSVARNRGFTEMAETRLSTPKVEDVEVSGSTIPGSAAADMLVATLEAVRTDAPPDIADDVESAVVPVQEAIASGQPAPADVRRDAIEAAGRLEAYAGQHC